MFAMRRMPAAARLLTRPMAMGEVKLVQLARAFGSLPPHTVLTMPALSPTMEKGTIASWTLKEGDQIVPGSPICEIHTDKANVDFEAQDEGFLAKILVQAGDSEIPVGQPIGVAVEEESDIAAFANYKPEGKAEEKTSKPESKAKESEPVPPPKKEETKKAAPQPTMSEEKAAPATPPPTPTPQPQKSSSAASPSPAQTFPQLKSPLAAVFKKSQLKYEELYGHTLMQRQQQKATVENKQ